MDGVPGLGELIGEILLNGVAGVFFVVDWDSTVSKSPPWVLGLGGLPRGRGAVVGVPSIVAGRPGVEDAELGVGVGGPGVPLGMGGLTPGGLTMGVVPPGPALELEPCCDG